MLPITSQTNQLSKKDDPRQLDHTYSQSQTAMHSVEPQAEDTTDKVHLPEKEIKLPDVTPAAIQAPVTITPKPVIPQSPFATFFAHSRSRSLSDPPHSKPETPIYLGGSKSPEPRIADDQPVDDGLSPRAASTRADISATESEVPTEVVASEALPALATSIMEEMPVSPLVEKIMIADVEFDRKLFEDIIDIIVAGSKIIEDKDNNPLVLKQRQAINILLKNTGFKNSSSTEIKRLKLAIIAKALELDNAKMPAATPSPKQSVQIDTTESLLVDGHFAAPDSTPASKPTPAPVPAPAMVKATEHTEEGSPAPTPVPAETTSQPKKTKLQQDLVNEVASGAADTTTPIPKPNSTTTDPTRTTIQTPPPKLPAKSKWTAVKIGGTIVVVGLVVVGGVAAVCFLAPNSAAAASLAVILAKGKLLMLSLGNNGFALIGKTVAETTAVAVASLVTFAAATLGTTAAVVGAKTAVEAAFSRPTAA